MGGGGGGATSPFYRNFNISLWFNENKNAVISVQSFTKYSVFIVDVKSGRFMYQSRRAGDEAKKRKSPAKSGRVSLLSATGPRLWRTAILNIARTLGMRHEKKCSKAPIFKSSQQEIYIRNFHGLS